jgi:hypothetical protein
LPSASLLFVKSSFASIAFRANVRDDRDTPLSAGAERAYHAGDLPSKESRIFSSAGLDRFLLICPSGKSARGDKRSQLGPHPVEDALIFPGLGLPEQAHGRIPGVVVAIE